MRGFASLLCFLFRNCRFELTATLRSRRRFTPSLLVLLQTSPSFQMGCCFSKSSVDEDDLLTGTGICQKQLYPPHISPTGLQVDMSPLYYACNSQYILACNVYSVLPQLRASTASWVATLPSVEFSTVMLLKNSIFLAFFESNSMNKAAAAYSLASAHQVFDLRPCHTIDCLSITRYISIDIPKVCMLCRHLRLLMPLVKVTCRVCYRPPSHPWMKASLLTHITPVWCAVRSIGSTCSIY